MRSIIRKTAGLPAKAEELFYMYLDPIKHGAITGSPVTINDYPGAEFRAFDGMLTGTILDIIKPQLIVQSWRSAHFKTYEKDSTLILNFSQKGDKGYIDLIHLDVPDHDYDAVTKGWEKYYFNPWREYLQNK